MRLFLLLLLLCSSTLATAQNLFVTKEKILAELEARGLTEEEVSEALEVEGIKLEYLDEDEITDEQIEVIQRVILRLEARKKKKEEQENQEDETDELNEDEEPEEGELDSLSLEEELDTLLVEPEITIYGQGLFRNDILEIQSSSEELKAPDSYVIGPGDDIVISVWGRSHFDNEFKVDERGYIRVIKGARRVYLKGLTLGQARSKLFSIFQDYYSFSEGEFDVSINFSRTIRISIYGEVVEKPGTYAIPAFNSAFNALAAVGGTNDIGSLRRIQLQKSNGQVKELDIYAFMRNPSISKDYYLEENDIILVPVSEKIVSIEGAIRRPLKYELLEREGLKELLDYAGGFTENAYLKKIQIQRYENDVQKIVDVDWRTEKNRTIELLHGDVIIVEEVEREFDNYVEVIGEVSKPGLYERRTNMRISDLLEQVGITEQSNTEVVFLERRNPDGTSDFRKLNLDNILKNPKSQDDILLKDMDKFEIWAKGRFNDEINVAIDGAVRFPGVFPFDNSRSVKVKDAILLAGGLRRDASNYAIIHRNDPLNPKAKYYKTVPDLEQIFEDPSDETNFALSPFDSLVVKSRNTFLEESFVRIEGAVNTPGEYQHGENMTIKDLMVLAGGFKMAASTNNIEISRVIIKNNQPTRTVVANLELDRNFNVIDGSGDYYLEPYDNIAVRFIKDFQLQKRVFLEGEVHYPGPYAIAKENEKVLSIIERAGGLTDEAFPAGATLVREEQDYGSVVIKLEEIINNPTSEFNFHVKNGDKIQVPKIKEFVTIKGATKAREVVSEESINEGNAIHVPFHKGKDAMFYINEYAGGLHEKADKSKIFVEHANGEIKRPRNGFLSKRYPKVYQGSVISVGFKSFETNEKEKKTEVDWTKVLGDSVAQAMSILTLIVLVSRLN